MNAMCGTDPWDGPLALVDRWAALTWADGPGWYDFGPLALLTEAHGASPSVSLPARRPPRATIVLQRSTNDVFQRIANGVPPSTAFDLRANDAFQRMSRKTPGQGHAAIHRPGWER